MALFHSYKIHNVLSRFHLPLKHFIPANSVKFHTNEMGSVDDTVKIENSHKFEKCINEVKLLGRVREDPIVTERNGKQFIQFFLLTSEEAKPNSLEQGRSQFHCVFTFHPALIKTVDRFVKKGDRLYVCGKLSYVTDVFSKKTHGGVLLQNFISFS